MPVFSDPIHGTFSIHDVCKRIVDTPEFQRLREIKQLGGTTLVYHAATHTRFEHSIGVSYLAKEWLTLLRKNQPELGITDDDCLCVQVAALCHDLGHGPFSHMFDRMTGVPHEEVSTRITGEICERLSLFGPRDIRFIKSLIAGSPKLAAPSGYKSFLYDIVSNSRSGIDVDKFDYFKRDCHALNLPMPVDPLRLMHMSRVSDADGEQQIVFHEKTAFEIIELFQTRYALHKKAYQHRVAMAVELMACDALKLASPFFEVLGTEGRPHTIVSSVHDTQAFLQVTDTIFSRIRWSQGEELAPARRLLERIATRDLYEWVGDSMRTSSEDIWVHLTKECPAEKLRVVPCNLSYGCGSHPFSAVRFFDRSRCDEIKSMALEDVAACVPSTYCEKWYRVFCVDPEYTATVKRAWKRATDEQ